MISAPGIPTVLELLQTRGRTNSGPRQRSDPYHLALVIEGGGMRGVAAGGMVSAIEDLGLRPAFDSVHGSSAGAAAGAYFVAGQANLGTKIFYEDINNNRFINLAAPLVGRPIMDVAYLVDEVMRNAKPLAYQKVLSGELPLNIVSTDIDAEKRLTISRYESEAQFRAHLKATVTLPLIGGRPYLCEGRRLYDGGLTQQIPIESAIESGSTHILALMTRRRDELERRAPNIRYSFESHILGLLYGQGLRRLYLKRPQATNNSIQICMSPALQETLGVRITTVCLPDAVRDLHRLTKDAVVLRRAEAEARRAIFDLRILG